MNLYTKNRSIISSWGYERRIAVDFDGCIAQMNSEDYHQIGKPVPGAKNALNELRTMGWYVVLWTSRVNALELSELSQAPNQYPKLMIEMLAWLEEYEIEYDEVFMGGQKPCVRYFIDDRMFPIQSDDELDSWADVIEKAGMPR